MLGFVHARKVAYGGILIVQPVLMDAGGSWGQNKASRPRQLSMQLGLASGSTHAHEPSPASHEAIRLLAKLAKSFFKIDCMYSNFIC